MGSDPNFSGLIVVGLGWACTLGGHIRLDFREHGLEIRFIPDRVLDFVRHLPPPQPAPARVDAFTQVSQRASLVAQQ